MKTLRILRLLFAALVVAPWGATALALESLDELRQIERKTEDLALRVMPSTVALISEQTAASGSGVVVDSDGLILTAAHVVDGADEVEVVFPNGKQVRGTVLGTNFSKDIGMVRINEEGDWPHVELGTSDDLEAGSWVVAMGHSEGFDPARTPPLRFGRVVSTGPGNFLTTDCTLIGGDSGGPLFDLDGKLVGINSSIGEALSNNNHAGIEGFREDWDRLIDGESWGELQLNPLANPERPMIGIEMGRELRDGGVPVARVTPRSPAAEAGLRRGDVIRGVDGVRVRGGRSLGLLLAKYAGGDTVTLAVQRGREIEEIDVTLIRMDELADLLER
jgi:serine protease Do